MTNHLNTAAEEIRKLYGPHAHSILLGSELTMDPPRVYIAASLIVYDKNGQWLLPQHDVLSELDLSCVGADEDPQDLVIEVRGGYYPFGDHAAYEEAFSGELALAKDLSSVLLDEDDLFDLYTALNDLARIPSETFILPDLGAAEQARTKVLGEMYTYLFDGEVGPDHADSTRWSRELLDIVLAGLSPEEFAALKEQAA